jgi:hypothetical protein
MDGPAVRPVASFKGGTTIAATGNYKFAIYVLGKSRYLGTYQPESAETGARLYDSLQLLLHGPRANTTFKWSAYTQGDVAAAAEVLQMMGIDVAQAMVHARTPGNWIGVNAMAGSWTATVTVYQGKGNPEIKVRWYTLQSAEVAAQQADCGFLAVHGLSCTTNFPASQYSKLQLEQAGECAISKGVDEMRVRGNLEAVDKVCFPAVPCCRQG